MSDNGERTIHYYVRGLFRDVPDTGAIREQREELEAHIRDHVADLQESGLSPDSAFDRAIASLGQLDELVETISGVRKKVYVNRVNRNLAIASIAYGTLYAAAVGIWFASVDFGTLAVLVAFLAWLGFALPSSLSLVRSLGDPLKIAAVKPFGSHDIRQAVAGWIALSVSCFAVNAIAAQTDTFLRVFWSWMPFFGILSWPLAKSFHDFLVRREEIPDSRGFGE